LMIERLPTSFESAVDRAEMVAVSVVSSIASTIRMSELLADDDGSTATLASLKRTAPELYELIVSTAIAAGMRSGDDGEELVN